MRFPKAQAGVSKLYTAEILILIGVICALIGMFVPFFLIVTAILSLIAFIMMMVGLGQAQQDDNYFRIAFICAIAGIVFSILSSIFALSSPVVGSIMSLLANIASLCVTVFAVLGIRSVSEKLGDSDLMQRAQRLLIIILVPQAIGLILRFVSSLIAASTAGAVVVIILGIIATILQIIGYVLFILLLKKAKVSFLQ